MTKIIKLKLLYYESNVIFALSKLFAKIAYKFMDKHHEIYFKYRKLMREVEDGSD